MGASYLIDTNIAIGFFNQSLPGFGYAFVETLPATLSVISRIELLGWTGGSSEILLKLETYVSKAFVYPLDEPVIIKTIELKQKLKIKLPDAIIAATALTHDLILLTRNISDFKNIPALKFFNPYEGLALYGQ